MSDHPTSENAEQQIFTREQVEAIVDAVTKRVKDSQAAEAEQRYRGVELPEEVYTELEGYNQHELQKALQKFKRTIPKYNNEEWNTPETTNPNFVSQLKQWKVDSLQLVNQIYKLTENMRVQARAATEIFEQLQYITERKMQPGDKEMFHDTVEKVRRLAVFGFGTAKQQELEAKEATTKALKLPYSLKHLENNETSEKKYAFDQTFIDQYYEESFRQRITGDASRNNQRPSYNRGRGTGNGSYGNRGGRVIYHRKQRTRFNGGNNF